MVVVALFNPETSMFFQQRLFYGEIQAQERLGTVKSSFLHWGDVLDHAQLRHLPANFDTHKIYSYWGASPVQEAPTL